MYEKNVFSYRFGKLMERAFKLPEERGLNPLKCYWLQYQERDQRADPGGYLVTWRAAQGNSSYFMQ